MSELQGPPVPETAPESVRLGWFIVDLMGHTRLAGEVNEYEMAGAKMLQVNVPATDRIEPFALYVNPAAVYALWPCDEAAATKAMSGTSHWQIPTPIQELYQKPVVEGEDVDFDGVPF